MVLAQEIFLNEILPFQVTSSHFVSLVWLFYFPNTGLHISLYISKMSFVPFAKEKE